MLLFAKDKDHMSGYVVIMFYILIGLDFIYCVDLGKQAVNNWVDWFPAIDLFLCAIGLIILLNTWKIGGYIVFAGSVILIICAFIPNMSTTREVVGLWLGIIHAILVSVVLFGSRNFYLK